MYCDCSWVLVCVPTVLRLYDAIDVVLGRDLIMAEWPVGDPTDCNGVFGRAWFAIRDMSFGP